MRVEGPAGTVVTATGGVDIPTVVSERPAHWPAKPQRQAWTSPIPRVAPVEPARVTAKPPPASRSHGTPRVSRPRTVSSGAPRVTKLETDTCALLYARGMSLTDIGRRFGATAQAVRARLVAAGVPIRAASRPDAGRGFHDAARTLRQDVRDDLTRMWSDDVPRDEIAERLGISVTLVGRIARELGLPRRRQALVTAEVVRLYREHRSTDAVAAILDTSGAAVRYQLDKAGEPRRAPGDNGNARPGEVRERALSMYQAGAPLPEIYRACGITESTLGRWRHAAGVPARKAGAS